MAEKFEIEKTPTFDLKQTLDCGQVFRYAENGGVTRLYAGCHAAEFTEKTDRYEVVCDDSGFFRKYLDFDTNYDIIQLKIQDKGLVSSAIEFGRGIHILRQEPLETIFSFIVSQNNHIPRIKGIINRLCAALGADMGGYHAFPTLEAFASEDEKFYADMGAGYRAAYLARVARELLREDLGEWGRLDTESLRAKLVSLYGVGRKVADCALLFGFNRFDVFPVDTWILKVFEKEYSGVAAEKLSKLLVQKYGEYSGFVQQWLFYFKREQKNYRQNATIIIK